MTRAWRWFLEHKRRLAPLVLAAGLAAVAVQVMAGWQHETDFRFDLGGAHGDVTSMDVTYALDGQLHHGATFRWPDGAPGVVRHVVELGPGRWEIVVTTTDRARGANEVRRAVSIPADGAVRVDVTAEAAP